MTQKDLSRRFGPKETRSFAGPVEVRSSADGKITIEGYAARFDEPAHGEVVKRSAFERTLRQQDDVRLLINHDGLPLARFSPRHDTLQLSTDDVGLKFRAEDLDPANPRVQELMSALSRRDVDQCSFSFYTVEAPVNERGLRELREVVLCDVSVVTWPWYESTSVSMKSRRLALAAELRALVDDGDGMDSESGDDAADDEWVSIATAALQNWLADEATEVALGTGGVAVVQMICQLLSDLSWTQQFDEWDDNQFAEVVRSVRAKLVPPSPVPDGLGMSIAEARALLGLDPVA